MKLSAPFFHPAQLPPFALVRRAGSRTPIRPREPLEFQQLALRGSWRRRHIVIQLARFRFRDVPLRKAAHDHVLFSKGRAADDDRIAFADEPMGPRSFAVDVDLAPLTRLLGLRACSKQTRNVEPDIEPQGCERSIQFLGFSRTGRVLVAIGV